MGSKEEVHQILADGSKNGGKQTNYIGDLEIVGMRGKGR